MNGNIRVIALIGAGVVALAAVAAFVYTGKTDAFGFASTSIIVLLAAAGLTGQIQTVHDKVDGITSKLVDTTASDSWQAGHAAPRGAKVPPAPSTREQPPPPSSEP